MGRNKVDEGIIWVVYTAPLPVGIVGSSQLGEVVTRPCHDAEYEHDDAENHENDEAEQVSAAPLFVYKFMGSLYLRLGRYDTLSSQFDF